MKPLQKICNILALQRDRVEREIAALNSQMRLIKNQIFEIELEKQKMTEAVYAGKLSGNIVQDAIALESWKTKQVHVILNLENEERGLIEARKPKAMHLKAVIVKQDILGKKLSEQYKAEDVLYTEAQTAERLEMWVNTHVL